MGFPGSTRQPSRAPLMKAAGSGSAPKGRRRGAGSREIGEERRGPRTAVQPGPDVQDESHHHPPAQTAPADTFTQ